MDEFLRACGAAGPLQLLVETPGLAAIRWDAPQPFALIGSDPAVDLSLDHPRIDGYHAYLQVIEGGVYCIDLGSQAGTRWEDGTSRSGWLDHSRGIGIGPYLIQLASNDLAVPRAEDRPDPLSSRSRNPDELPRVILEFRRDGAKPIRWRMRHMLTLVGTSPHCKVRLAAPGVSPFHCSLLRTAAGMWAVNLLGQEGVTVNGSNIRAARLDEGDELRVGEIMIRVLYEDSAAENELRLIAGEDRARTAFPAHSRELATSRSQAVWMGVGGEADRLLTDQLLSPGALPAPLLALVLDQFGQMQQQFLSQFQQTTVMLFKALGTMHRDQMEELRTRLESLHQIGESLQGFQAQLANSVQSGPGSPAPGSGGLPPHTPVTPPLPGKPAGGKEGPGRGTPFNGATASGAPPAPADPNGAERLRAKVRSLSDDPDMTSLNVHEWLIGRLAAIEDEQRSRWQKILDLMRGR